MQKARHLYYRDIGLFQNILPNWTDAPYELMSASLFNITQHTY
ncbi:hypothetical protein SPSE_0162 [Staphylococcus pseudintermedius ED99]|nr:hypothetical protein SPSE_0162 [Staphylococcus pseudintermedius ED99]